MVPVKLSEKQQEAYRKFVASFPSVLKLQFYTRTITLIMFACVAAGRPAQTDFGQMDATHFVLQIPDAENVNHLALYLTTVPHNPTLTHVYAQPLPAGYAATVHFMWPTQSWQLLGTPK